MDELLLLAKEDFDVVQILYKEKKYSNALYHYHQCVEKSVKYIGLSIGGISEDQLNKDIKHDPTKVFKYLFKYVVEQSNGLVPPIDPYLFSNTKQDIESKSEAEIIGEAIRDIKAICNEEKLINEDKYPTHFDAVCNYISNVLPDLDTNMDNEMLRLYIAKRLEPQIEKTIIFINYGIRILRILMIHSFVCWKFRPDDCRYSSAKFGNPVIYFSDKNPIIKNLPFLIKSMNIPITFAREIDWRQGFIF